MAHDIAVRGDSFQSKIKSMLEHLEGQHYSKASLSVYKCALGHLTAYMNEKAIGEYSPVIGDDFIKEILKRKRLQRS